MVRPWRTTTLDTRTPARRRRSRQLAIALGLICAFLAVEIAAGVIAHSLALLSDAGHMLTDAAAIAFSLVAIGSRRARREGG